MRLRITSNICSNFAVKSWVLFLSCSSVRVPLVDKTKRICDGLLGVICEEEVRGMVIVSSTGRVVDIKY